MARCESHHDELDSAILRLKIGLDKRTPKLYTYKEDMQNVKRKVTKVEQCVKKLYHYHYPG